MAFPKKGFAPHKWNCDSTFTFNLDFFFFLKKRYWYFESSDSYLPRISYSEFSSIFCFIWNFTSRGWRGSIVGQGACLECPWSQLGFQHPLGSPELCQEWCLSTEPELALSASSVCVSPPPKKKNTTKFTLTSNNGHKIIKTCFCLFFFFHWDNHLLTSVNQKNRRQQKCLSYQLFFYLFLGKVCPIIFLKITNCALSFWKLRIQPTPSRWASPVRKTDADGLRTLRPFLKSSVFWRKLKLVVG